MQKTVKLLIAIDGPAGAGKTTVSRVLADRLGYRYIDTGALYRGVAYEVIQQAIDPEDDTDLERLCGRLNLKFVERKGSLRLFSGETDISAEIRTPRITMLASAVSARPVIRNFLLDLQRKLGQEKAAVFEGRDMGTVVFPDADLKFYLDASTRKRALRRFAELKSKTNQTLKEVENEILQRDQNDSTRNIAPLKPAPDAIIIDSTNLTVNEVVDAMVSHIEKLAPAE